MKSLRLKLIFPLAALCSTALFLTLRTALSQTQDWLEIGINRGQPSIRLAVTDFPAQSSDQQISTLAQEFNQVLHDDLGNSGIFTLVGKSNFPVKTPVEAADVDFKSWTDPPRSPPASLRIDSPTRSSRRSAAASRASTLLA